MRRAWELLYLLTLRELKLRYQDTFFGFLWSLIRPLLQGAVLFVVLKKFIRIDVEDYHLVLLAGLFPWTWFQTSLVIAVASFASNGALIKKVYFPRFVLPLATVMNNGVQYALSIPVLVLLLLVSGYTPDWTWLVGIPLLLAVEAVLIMGIVLLIASLDVYFRDLEHLTDVFVGLIWFYLTPVIYPLSIVPEKYHDWVLLNPMASLIEGWRDLFLHNQLPGADLWPALAFAGGIAAVGSLSFRTMQGGFADAL
ncbi:MAG TPA: ABC transporter permease [Dehalococcoidia bacterium]|jgi:lipopolysaccharide transport system permease protein|nr:ABC transporter permease [Dehalococcoidia bacterium]